MKIAIIQIILGKYDFFWEDFYKSCEANFCTEDQKNYYIFSDKELKIKNKRVNYLEQDYLGWPFSTLYRYHMILRIEKRLQDYDSIVFFNANTFIKEKIKYVDFFGDNSKKLVAGIHPLLKDTPREKLPVEKRNNLECYIDTPLIYVQGCINGGKAKYFLKVIKELKNKIDKDISSGLLAVWHDESYWNFIINNIFLNDKSSLQLISYEYLMPSNLINKFSDVKPKIIMISKDKFGSVDLLRHNINQKYTLRKITLRLKNILNL